MKIAFHGAARTVTGSKHLLTLKNGKKYLLDCGILQGLGATSDVLHRNWGLSPLEVDNIIICHAHIGHSGLIPKLVKDGFSGKIFCTPATKELTAILLEDSAGIQQDDIKYVNRRRKAEGLPYLQPLYDEKDAERAMQLFTTVEYDTWHTIDENVQVLYTDAGHIIGSAAVHLRIKEDNKDTHLSFSGDGGRYRDVILKSPEEFPQTDYILIESTYSNSLPDPADTTLELFLQRTDRACL